jgi:hypothetical protein
LSLSRKQRAFLAAYGRLGIVVDAAKAARVAHTVHYKWLKHPEYKAAFADAEEEAIGVLESEAHQRAMYGTAEPVIWRGKICYEPQRDPKTGQVKRDRKGQPLPSTTPLTIRRPSDNLLMFLLKKLDPSEFVVLPRECRERPSSFRQAEDLMGARFPGESVRNPKGPR